MRGDRFVTEVVRGFMVSRRGREAREAPGRQETTPGSGGLRLVKRRHNQVIELPPTVTRGARRLPSATTELQLPATTGEFAALSGDYEWVPEPSAEHISEESSDLVAVGELSTTPEINTRTARSLLLYVADRFGKEALERVAARAGLDSQTLVGKSEFVSYDQYEVILTACRRYLRDDEEFLRACVHHMREAWGPFVHLIRTASLGTIYRQFLRAFPQLSRYSRFDTIAYDSSSLTARYFTERDENRLACLSRQAFFKALPTIWGLPAAQLEESTCVAHGDGHCEYSLRWHEQVRWHGVALGMGSGALMAMIGASVNLAFPPMIVLPAIGGLLGYAWEVRRALGRSQDFGEETNQHLRELARSYMDANDEILDLNQRQHEWNRALEHQVSERSARLQEIVETATQLGEQRETTLRSMSHDLRNPLTVLRMAKFELKEILTEDGADENTVTELVTDMDVALNDMDRLVKNLLESARGGTGIIELQPQDLPVKPMVERLRRRVQALVRDRDIRVSVFRSREAPNQIFSDELLFDRVVDNLLSNAAKYTEQGSIVVEVTGVPGMLTVKVSDTGPGISGERIEKVFRSEGHPNGRDPDGSYGFGLSIVVRLLNQIRGRLEVMSKPNVGTTFWAHFPVDLEEEEHRVGEDMDEIVDRVVTIRRLVGA